MPANPENPEFPAPDGPDTPAPTTTINWQAKCAQLEHQISTLKQVSTLRKNLLDIRSSESKALILKLKYLEDQVVEERNSHRDQLKRLEAAELECIDLRDRQRRNIAAFEKLKASHEEQFVKLESVELKYKQQSSELEETTLKNSELKGKLDELTMELNENEKALKGIAIKVKKATDRNLFFASQVSLINEILHENDELPIDLQRIKAILRQSEEETNNKASSEGQEGTNEDDEGVELSCLQDNSEEEEIPGEESCYKTVDTSDGPQLILSVSRTFIKLKDLILEKRSLQKEIDGLKNLNTKLETKVDKQEHRLYCVTKELNRTWSLVSTLKQQQNRLHNYEAVLKYELKEKRVLLERLKKELLSYRDKWRKVREKNSESQTVWNQLRDEFAQRREQSLSLSASASEESSPEDKEGTPDPSRITQRRPSSL